MSQVLPVGGAHARAAGRVPGGAAGRRGRAGPALLAPRARATAALAPSRTALTSLVYSLCSINYFHTLRSLSFLFYLSIFLFCVSDDVLLSGPLWLAPECSMQK